VDAGTVFAFMPRRAKGRSFLPGSATTSTPSQQGTTAGPETRCRSPA